MPDSDGYPTEEELEKLRTWKYEDPRGALEFARSCWWAADWGWPSLEGEVSTGGWSGNESIISALQENFLIWHQVWHATRRGGHYILRLSESETCDYCGRKLPVFILEQKSAKKHGVSSDPEDSPRV